MDCPNVRISQFMEELTEWIVLEMGMKYVPRHYDAKKERHIATSAIKHCIISIGKNIYQPYGYHIEDVLSVLLRGKCEVYVDLLGDYMFNEHEYSWSHFRVFLTFICILCSISFKNKHVHLTDDLIISSTMYIERKLSQYIGKHEGWIAFEWDCAKTALRMQRIISEEKMKHWKAMPSEEQEQFASEVEKASESVQLSLEKQSYSKSHFPEATNRPLNTITDVVSNADLIAHVVRLSTRALNTFRSNLPNTEIVVEAE